MATASIELGDGLVEAELARDELAVGVEVHARQRPRSERQARALALGEGETLAVARQHPEVGEQVVAEVDGLGALQMRVAGQRPVDVLLSPLDQRPHQPRRRRLSLARPLAGVHDEVCRDLVVARASRVQLAPDRPDQLCQMALDRHVDVFVALHEHEATRAPAHWPPRQGRAAVRRDPHRR